MRGGRASAAASLLALAALASCQSRTAPLTLPHGHPADPATAEPVVAEKTSYPAPGAAAEVPAKAPMGADAPEGMIYQCPMHAEVTSHSPGKCPKCGMVLRLVPDMRDKAEHR